MDQVGGIADRLGDRLDGLNKTLNAWDTQYYKQVFNTECHLHNMPELEWPARKSANRINIACGVRLNLS